jgi:hypothetical protein
MGSVMFKYKKIITNFLIILLVISLLCGCARHKTDENVINFLYERYNEEFEIVSKTTEKAKGTEASCTKNVKIRIWKTKSKSSGKEVEVREYYRMGAFTCEYELISYDK